MKKLTKEKKWRISKDGIKIIEFCEKIMPEIDKLIEEDAYLKKLKGMTTSI